MEKGKTGKFITIPDWMVTKLHLRGADLVCFALVYGFCQDEETPFYGSLEYVSRWLDTDRSNARKTLMRLVNAGFLTKIERENASSTCKYSVNFDFVGRKLTGCGINATGCGINATGCGINATNNIDYNKEDNIGDKIGITPLTPRGEFGQSENCPPPPPSTDENFKNFSVSVATGTIPVNTTATAVSEKEKSSARKEKENQPILGDLFGGVVQITAETAKPAKNGRKSDIAEVLRTFWNSICVPKGFASVKELNQARIDKASAMVKEMLKENVSAQELFDKIVNAQALWENRSNGGEDGSWFNFDWLIQGKRRGQMDTNWKLIMSGRYDRSFRKGLFDKRSQSAQQMQRAGEFLGTLEKEHPELSPLEMLEIIQQH